MKKYYYKVTNKYNQSCRMLMGDCGVQYKQNEWVRPYLPGSKNYVFGTIKQAEKFIKETRSLADTDKIWKCEVINPNKALGVAEFKYEIRAFWRGRIHDDEMVKAPTGTYTASEVKLIEEIKQ